MAGRAGKNNLIRDGERGKNETSKRTRLITENLSCKNSSRRYSTMGREAPLRNQHINSIQFNSRDQMDNKEKKGWMEMTEKKGKEGEKYVRERK